MSLSSKIFKYEADDADSVISFTSSSLGYFESTLVWKQQLLIDNISSIYQHFQLKTTVSEYFSTYMMFLIHSASYEYNKNLRLLNTTNLKNIQN